MKEENDVKRTSKFLSLVLRHKPELIGLSLDANGWADVPRLLQKVREKGFEINEDDLDFVVSTNSKKRFAYNDDKTKIRANQGHSIDIELDLPMKIPPQVLYHGTGAKSLDQILQQGLTKMSRQHVHLSADFETAVNVGKRHGAPRVLKIAAAEMHKDGFTFYFSANEVWLTDHVPSAYLRLDI